MPTQMKPQPVRRPRPDLNLFRHLALLFFCLSSSSCSSISDQTQDAIGSFLPFIGPSNSRIGEGLRSGLELGAVEAVDRLSAASSFATGSASRMPIPAELKRLTATMKRLKRDTEINTLEDKLNDAARATCADAVEVLRSEIAAMNFADANAVLHGQGAAATDALRAREAELVQALLPLARRRLDEVGASRAGEDLIKSYQAIPFAQTVNCDFDQAVAATCVSRLLAEIADFEIKLRNQPARRNSDLLRRVFAEQDDE
ncbi:MAG: hypothetical protein RL095_748 [Verrucomicrobiota bacterium]|jgi:hypothetical protein